MTVKRIVATMLTAEPGLAKPFYGSIFDMHPVMDHGWIQIRAADGDPTGPQLGFASEGGVILARSIEGREVNLQVKYNF